MLARSVGLRFVWIVTSLMGLFLLVACSNAKTPVSTATSVPAAQASPSAGAATATPGTVATAAGKPEELREFTAAGDAYPSLVWTGAIPTAFHEAPDLAALVQQKLLPPVEERLPKEPLVVNVQSIGRYGGSWRRQFTGSADGQNVDRIQHDLVIEHDNDAFTLVPNIAKSWSNNADYTEWTINLREGMKWSDGQPFTADDFVFAHEDQTANAELQPTLKWPALKDPGTGTLAPIVKINDYSFKYVFTKPMPRFVELYSGSQGGQSLYGRLGGGYYAPAHYMKQFHPKYTAAADLTAMAKAAGFDTWVQLYNARGNPLINLQLPVVSPWKVVSPFNSQVYVAERNPYYFAVDPEGNQLPYIDKLTMFLASNTEIVNLRAIAGEVDMQERHIQVAKISVLKENAAKNNYTVTLNSSAAPVTGLTFNQTYNEDAEVAKWIQTKDFRIALSHAIDRKAINEIIFLGIGKPTNGCVRLAAYAPPKDVCDQYESYAEFSPDKANALLDKIGLTAKDSGGYRLRTDGKGRISLPLSYPSNYFIDGAAVGQIVIENLRKVGIEATLNPLELGLYSTRQTNNEIAISLNAGAFSSEMFATGANSFGTLHSWLVGPLYSLNYETKGAQGVAPTGDFLRLRQLWDQGTNLPFDQRLPLGKEAVTINMQNVWQIGFVGSVPCGRCVVVKKNYFKNVPAVTSLDGNWPGEARPEQFWMDQ